MKKTGHTRTIGDTSIQDSFQGEIIRVEIIYKPGPIEHLFSGIGKFFDVLFNRGGRKVKKIIHPK